MQSPRPCSPALHRAVQPSRTTRGSPAAATPGGGGGGRVAQSAPQQDAASPATPVAPASDIQTRQLRLLPWQTSASLAKTAQRRAAQHGSTDAAPVAGAPPPGPATGQSNGTASALPQRRRAPSGGTLCDVCGGQGSLPGPRGSQPCPACQQRPARAAAAPPAPETAVGPTGADGSAAGSDSQQSGDEARRRRRKSGPMSPERRQAISRALASKGAKSAEHKRSISRAMREAHARNPELRRSAAGRRKRCGHCGQEGHNRKTCPVAAAEAAAAAAAAAQEAAGAEVASAAGRVIVIEEVEAVDEGPLPPAGLDATAAGAAAAAATSSEASSGDRVEGANGVGGSAAAAAAGAVTMPALGGPAAAAADDPVAAVAAAAVAAVSPPPLGDLLPTRQLAPGLALSPEGGWIFPLPRSKEECVAQAAQAALRAWDDGVRRQALELLLPQADPSADGGWPGGIRQQFRVAKPMVEALLMRLKRRHGLEGRITAELLDEGDCVGAWQSERLCAVLFPTADTLPDLRKIDDALSGKRLTIVVNPQWQPQGQVISDFGFGRSRKAAERFVAGFEEVYYLRRVRVFGDDIRILRCYPGQWQVHYMPAEPGSDTVLLSSEDTKPTFQRLIQLLKAVKGTRASKTWLDRVLTSSMGSFNEFAAYSPEAAAAAAAALAAEEAAGQPTLPDGSAAGQAGEGAEERGGLQRDIVTGELLPLREGEAEAADGSAPGVARDIRLEPLSQITKWLP